MIQGRGRGQEWGGTEEDQSKSVETLKIKLTPQQEKTTRLRERGYSNL